MNYWKNGITPLQAAPDPGNHFQVWFYPFISTPGWKFQMLFQPRFCWKSGRWLEKWDLHREWEATGWEVRERGNS